MASTCTFSLTPETVSKLDRLAKETKTSKSELVRRAIELLDSHRQSTTYTHPTATVIPTTHQEA